MIKRIIILQFFFINILGFSQEIYSGIEKVINGRWKGFEQRKYEWGKPVLIEKEPLFIELKFIPDSQKIYVKRFFNFIFNDKVIDMVTENQGYYHPKHYFLTTDEYIISDYCKYFYPGQLSNMPHYLFEEGLLKFYLEDNKLVLYGLQKILEREIYDTTWKNIDFGVTRRFRKNTNRGELIISKQKGPFIVPGGFFYKGREKNPNSASRFFNRYMAVYEWRAERRLKRNDLKQMQNYFAKTTIKKNPIEEILLLSDVDSIEVYEPRIEVKIYDDDKEDGDTISVYLNNRLLASRLKVKKKGEILNLELNKGVNLFTIFAENEGSIPPNTAALTFYDRRRKQTIILNNKKGNSRTLKIFLR